MEYYVYILIGDDVVPSKDKCMDRTESRLYLLLFTLLHEKVVNKRKDFLHRYPLN